jgi:glyoxylase-like metal-dependent hydrolase (beta-lactamase superfamily II)
MPTHVRIVGPSRSGVDDACQWSCRPAVAAFRDVAWHVRPVPYHPLIIQTMPKPFASSADLAEKEATLEELADGVYAFTAQGDPNVGAIVGTDAILAIEARATPLMAQRWIDVIRASVSPKPFGDLVLTHYHAVRTLGASAFGARRIVAHTGTAALIEERGAQDWASEQGRMPRLFLGAETIPGLTRPTDTFDDALTIDLGNRRVELRHLGRGHTSGDLVVWLPDERICFAGDLVEAQAAPYMGDAHVVDWSSTTLDNVAALDASQLVGGRGPVVRDADVPTAIEDTRAFLRTTLDRTHEVRDGGGTLRQAFERVHAELAPRYAGFPIFEHCMPFNVQRTWDELDGIDHPRIWTAERDREVWDALQD